jgi:GDSL-like Lipase/Acylhydrolase
LKFKGYNGFIPNIVQENTKTAFITGQPGKLTKYTGENNNLGMPFMKMAEIDDKNIRSYNAFFERLLAENATNITYLQKVEAANPTFFTCWLGNNDVLSYASSGGKNAITDKTLFTNNLKKLLDVLTKNGAKGVVSNIGDITAAPAITLLSTFRPLFANTKFYIQTKTGVREGTAKDYLLIPNNINGLDINNIASKGTKISEPWADGEVLDSDEVAIVQKATLEFNQIMEAEAKARNLAYLDSFAFLNKLKAGITENGETVDLGFISGGIFSVDGAHLTPKGNAFAANEYLKVINNFYKTNIPLLDTKLYKGVVAE